MCWIFKEHRCKQAYGASKQESSIIIYGTHQACNSSFGSKVATKTVNLKYVCEKWCSYYRTLTLVFQFCNLSSSLLAFQEQYYSKVRQYSGVMVT